MSKPFIALCLFAGNEQIVEHCLFAGIKEHMVEDWKLDT